MTQSSANAEPISSATGELQTTIARLLENSTLLVALTDTEGGLRHANPALRALFPQTRTLAEIFTATSATKVREQGLPSAARHGIWTGTLTLGNGQPPAVVQATFVAQDTGLANHPLLALLTPHTPTLTAEAEDEGSVPDLSSRLAVPLYHETRFLDPANIHFLEAQGSYTLIHLDEDEILTSLPLASFPQALPEAFLRVHRSFIVNLHHIQSVFRRENRLFLRLYQADSPEIPVSRRRERAIRAILDTANKLKGTTR